MAWLRDETAAGVSLRIFSQGHSFVWLGTGAEPVMAPQRGDPMRDEPDSPLSAVGRLSGYGLQLAAAVGLFMAVGWWVDGKLGTRPILAIAGALVGAAGGFYSLYVHLVKGSGIARREGDEDS